MSIFRKFLKQSSHYFLGEFLSMLSGFISFPIFTRIFSKEEYGIISLVTITLTLANTLISGGLRPAIVRFYPQAKKEGDVHLRLLYSTMVLTVLSLGIIGIAVLVFLTQFSLLKFLNPVSRNIISFASVLILYRVTTATIRSFLQCEDKTVLFNITYVLEKYLGLGFALIFIIYLHTGVAGLFIGLIAGESLIFVFLLVRVVLFLKGGLFKFSRPLLLMNISYGLPLLASNLAGFINNSGSRYLIEYFIGTAAVGVYSVGFNLAMYIQNLLIFTLNKALIPITMNLWVEKGKRETQEFLTRFINYYFMVGIPIVFGLTAIGKNFLIFIASEKYAESADIIFWIITSLIIAGGYFPLLAGLYLEKKTKIVAYTLILGAAVNMIMSVILIPLWGLVGAAVATLLGNLAYIMLGFFMSRKLLKVKIAYVNLLKYTLFSIVMYFSIVSIEVIYENVIFVLTTEILLGIMVYGLLISFFDTDVKMFIKTVLVPKLRSIRSK